MSNFVSKHSASFPGDKPAHTPLHGLLPWVSTNKRQGAGPRWISVLGRIALLARDVYSVTQSLWRLKKCYWYTKHIYRHIKRKVENPFYTEITKKQRDDLLCISFKSLHNSSIRPIFAVIMVNSGFESRTTSSA